jgi:dihydroorotase
VSTVSIVGGRVVDPANGLDEPLDLHIAQGRIRALGRAPEAFRAERVIDAEGLVVCPGLVDLSAHLREPGAEHKATIASETAAAAAAGITTLCCPPDTQPVIDTPAVVELIRRKAKHSRCCMVLPVGALTRGLEGVELAEMAALRDAGCLAVSNGHAPLGSTLVERRALEYASTYGLRVFLRPEDRHLRDGGCAHEGMVSTRLGLPGIPEAAETVAVARDIALCEQTGAGIHFRGLSTAKAVRMIERARRDRLPITADVAAHQLFLTELDVDGFDTRCHVAPPLRTTADRDGLRAGVASGVVSAICSDHQPHEPDAKDAPFAATAPGISALETLLPLTLRLVQERVLGLADAIARVTCGPADVLGVPLGRLGAGARADVCVLDPGAHWTLEPERLRSQGRCTPFAGWELTGRVRYTLFEGRVVYEAEG